MPLIPSVCGPSILSYKCSKLPRLCSVGILTLNISKTVHPIVLSIKPKVLRIKIVINLYKTIWLYLFK